MRAFRNIAVTPCKSGSRQYSSFCTLCSVSQQRIDQHRATGLTEGVAKAMLTQENRLVSATRGAMGLRKTVPTRGSQHRLTFGVTRVAYCSGEWEPRDEAADTAQVLVTRAGDSVRLVNGRGPF